MKSNYTDRQYADDSVLLDGLYEFHPEFFAMLEPGEWGNINKYYLTGEEDVPSDVAKYRRQCKSDDPSIEVSARQALEKLLMLAGITGDPTGRSF